MSAKWIMRSDQANYQRSNAILAVEMEVSEEARALVRRIQRESGETGHRQVLAVELCDALCDGARIDVVRRVTISDARQWHRRSRQPRRSGRGRPTADSHKDGRESRGRIVFRQYGYYHPVRRYMYITNRTAARGQLLSAGAFLETLLHEWTHHYDHTKLALRSIHTSGFYARLKSLKAALL